MSWQERFSSKMNRSSWKTAHDDAHPQIEDWKDLDAHLMNHHSGDFIGDRDDHEWYHLDPDGYNDFHHENNWPIEDNEPDHYHTNDYKRLGIPDSLPSSFASVKIADPGSLRGEGVPAFTEPGYQDDQDVDDQTVGPQDLDSNATEVDKFPKSVGVFHNSSIRTSWSEFGNPIDYNENRMQNVEAPGLEIKTPLDTGKRNYSEQRQDANPLTLRSWFTGDDVNGPWPHTKNLSGPLDFEPTDNQNEDSTGPVLSSFQERYAHMEGVNHPWPQTNDEATDHLTDGHHEAWIQNVMKYHGKSREQVINRIREVNTIIHTPTGEELAPIDAHIHHHKNSDFRKMYPSTHEHDDDDLGVDIPENIETIAPTYVTSSWHQSFVETIPTHPDEEQEDSLLNPADELKNGRPRANDLPQQSAQLIPGMLIDHDQMGGSGTASGSF